MRNSIFIQSLAFILCFAMISEVSLPVHLMDAVSIEMDSETEHEESSEKEKEKSTTRLTSFLNSLSKSERINAIAINQVSNWTSPAIDSVTPPPEAL